MIHFAPEGYPFVLVPATAGVLAWVCGYQPLAIVLWLVALACISFFRDPKRESKAPPEVIVAPADGKVLSVGPAPAVVATLGCVQQISIFMSPANVHVNRAPVSGRVRDARHVAGTKFPAFRDKASEFNEHSFVVIDSPWGPVAYKQIAGALARRVVCDLAPGEAVVRGQRVGMIKFSSRVDLFLPADTVVEVQVGQRTRAGESVIARFPALETP